MEQFEQLLTCAICLDRYRNPKLLPCQHSFCMEPCMDGLVDYVRRQVKCPECRAEHRIPYQGVQGYPTNVTLQRFLELHIEITGELPDPTSGQIMERCNVCSEKAYCSICVHCEKKICNDCKGAHMDILRREISRINNQVRRALHRLEDALGLVAKNMLSLQTNCTSVSEEVDEIYRRLNKALKDRTEFLRGEIDRYMTTELRNLTTLKEHLELEISNIQSNCDLADKHMTDAVEWDDCELMDAKEIFLKTVEFIRNFEYENTDYNRRVRFSMSTDPNQLVLHVAGYGELSINMPHQHFPGGGGMAPGSSSGGLLQPPGMGGSGPGLMRSKSDHRLASQYRQQQEGYDGDQSSGRVSPLGGRKFGERYSRGDRGGYDQPSSRYGRGGGDYSGEFESPYDNESSCRPRKYRSRLSARHLGGDADSDNDAPRSVRFSADHAAQHKERERVLDTEDVARGPLSGISRLYDSPRVMKRLQESEQGIKKKDKEPAPAPVPQFKPLTPQPQLQQQAKRGTQRQVSEDDEISKIKRANKTTTPTTSTETSNAERPMAERVAALKSRDASSGEDRDSSQPSSPTARTSPSDTPGRKASATEVASSDAESDEDSPVASLPQRKTTATSGTGSKTSSRRSSTSSDQAPAAHVKATRSASSDSTTSTESSTAAATGASTTAPTSPPAGSGSSTPRTRISSTGSETPAKKPFQSRFLANRQQQQQQQQQQAAEKTPAKEEEEDEDESEESSSESEETDSEEESADDKKTTTEPATTTSTAAPASSRSALDRTDVGALLARSAQARDTAEQTRRNSRDDTAAKPAASRYDSSYTSRYGTAKDRTNEDTSSPRSYGYTSRFLNKSKSSAAVSPDEEDSSGGRGSKYSSSRTSASAAAEEDSKYPSGRSRYAALKDRRSRLARSRSSHNFGGAEDDEDDRPSSPTNMPSSYLASRYGPGSSSTTSATGSGTTSNDLARSRSTHALKTSSPDRNVSSTGGSGAAGSGGSEKDGAALSSWARYLKNKYGNKSGGKEGHGAGSSSGSPSSSATAARRLSLGLPLRHTNSVESSDDDQKNPGGSPTSPTAATAAAAAAAAGFAVAAGSSPRSQYLQKRRQQFKIGSRGSEPGCFTWPRGIAVGPDNSIVVADSSNHRVQVFDANGIFVKEFGSYGNAEGEFDCLAGVAVNRIGQFIIADRYNHRIQVMDPQGRFLRAFGSQGTADGRFNYPWGITTDALGFIYVCDKENHRVQVFQSDGTFVGKFGSCGSKPGQLEHPHYIAVSSTNRVIVSDSNNHRIQIFDVNGRVLTTFGSEGSDEGQFKFPRGVAVDDQGYIFVADSGNNRIQIFHPDGTFLRAFGCWGSGDGEFKGLEGIAVMSNGNILVCDRENHRIQVF